MSPSPGNNRSGVFQSYPSPSPGRNRAGGFQSYPSPSPGRNRGGGFQSYPSQSPARGEVMHISFQQLSQDYANKLRALCAQFAEHGRVVARTPGTPTSSYFSQMDRPWGNTGWRMYQSSISASRFIGYCALVCL